MITKEKAIKAQEIINQYNIEVNKKLIAISFNKKNIANNTCICCKSKLIKPLEVMGLAEGMVKATEQEQGCWDDGTVQKISFGYGSKNDGRSFYIAICDDCILQLEKDGLVTDFEKLRKEEAKYDL